MDKYPILGKITEPTQIKKLKKKELPKLAAELRRKIITTVAETGGHLAPSLGVIELTIALHYVFDAPKDKIVWDVGHQAYAHKLLTGRSEKFHTLRCYHGISGFPKRSESIYDTLDTGHSSTSISAALGMSTAMSMTGKKGKVVAVIGDGSMTAGLAFEALNNAGHLKKDLIVILNDNEMSISPNVGALSSYLSRKLTAPMARRLKRDIEAFLKRSDVGENIWSLLKRSEESLKSLLTPGMLFEALQFEYVGPLPGHNLETLIDTLSNVKGLPGPVLVHVLTKKGKGYGPAERHPDKFHGVGPFDLKTGELKRPKEPKPPSYTSIFSQTIIRLAHEDERIVAITAAMPAGTGLSTFAKEFPERFFDVGIAEQHAVTFAAGLALEGLKPVVAIYSTFLQRAYDQIIHDICLTGLPVVFAIDRAGLVGDDGPTHHGAFDLSFLRAVPNMIVMAPKDENELRHMLHTAFKLHCPVAIRYPRGAGVGASLDWKLHDLPLGKGEILRNGKDAALIAIGNMVQPSLEASDILSESGIETTVVNARFVKPIDHELIAQVAKDHSAIVTLEENAVHGGFGSAIMESIVEQQPTIKNNTKFLHIGLPDYFIEHGSQSILREKLGLDPKNIAKKIMALLKD